MSRHLKVIITTASLLLAPVALAAQQTQLDLHGNFAKGTSTHVTSWGGGIGAQVTFGSTTDPIQLSLAPSLDILKQEHGGPTQTSLSADIDIQPGGGNTLTPYAGVSAGANWSGGSNAAWEGTKLGLETLAGLTAKLSSSLSLKGEERFGYVTGQEHTLTTKVGVLVSF